MNTLVPVVLCGGSGSRLWPLSREAHPKQFLKLFGEESMLHATLRRLDGLQSVDVSAPIVVCNSEHRFLAAEQLRQAGASVARIILEPVGRNTAPALTLAALAACRDVGHEALLLVMPADHLIRDRVAFHRAVLRGAQAADNGALVTFGVVPDCPETGYGYIRAGVEFSDGILALDAFVEKPDGELAANYVADGYLWNSGIFLMRASVWLKALAQLQPEILGCCTQAIDLAHGCDDFTRIAEDPFKACPSDSIDYAVMEHVGALTSIGISAAVVPMSAGWSDVGAWDAVWDACDKDQDGNATLGDVMLEACSGSLVHASGRFVAAVGLDNVVVVETPDAVLVADKRHTQSVKKVVTAFKQEGRALANTHRKVYRPWGWYDSIDFGDRFQVKRIVVNPGASLSLQMHHHRAEHWVVVQGTAEVTNGDKVFLLSENESTFIPVGHVHRLANPGKVPLELIEVQSGSYLGEDDIVRFEDTYGRASG